MKNDEPVFVIGHPCGLPQKMAARRTRAEQLSPPRTSSPTSTPTAAIPARRSSAPTSYQLEGLLVRGQTDFVSTGSCNVSMIYPTTGAGGEDVTRTHRVDAGDAEAAGARRGEESKGAKASRAKAPEGRRVAEEALEQETLSMSKSRPDAFERGRHVGARRLRRRHRPSRLRRRRLDAGADGSFPRSSIAR